MNLNGIEHHFIDLDGQRTSYYEAGQGENTILLLHGGGIDSAMISWGKLIGGLSARQHIIAPDLPGYGQSDQPDITYTQAFYLDFLTRFLDALNLEKVSLAGLSLGGGISLGFALNFPRRVEKLVLLDSYGIMPETPYHKLSYLLVHTPINEFFNWYMKHDRNYVRQSLKAMVYDPQNITDELLDEIMQAVQSPFAGRAFMSTQRNELGWNSLRTNYTGRLSELNIPTLILQGDHDNSVPLKWVQQAHALIKNSRLVILKNRKHWVLSENPQEIVEILREFLESS